MSKNQRGGAAAKKTEPASRERKSEAAPKEKPARNFQAPKGFTRQSSDAVGFWVDDGESSILFVPTGVKLMDGKENVGGKDKPSIMLVGVLKAPTPLANKEEDLEGQVGDIVAVFWRPGMGREIVHAYGVETWIAPLYDENGERATQDVKRPQRMKLYDVRFGSKLQDKRVPILSDSRKASKHVATPFDDPSLAPVRQAAKNEDADDVGEDDIPF